MSTSKSERLRSELGGNICESMGVRNGASTAAPAVPVGLPNTQARNVGASRPRDTLLLELGRIQPDPNQPRKEFPEEELRLLAESLKTRGQLQPIRVRWSEDEGVYIIVSGERRWRAAQLAGLPHLACVLETRQRTPDELIEDQLVENCLREDLKPVEQARAFKRLMDTQGLTIVQVAARLNLHHSVVSRALALLELSPAVQAAVEQGKLKTGTALEIGQLKDADNQDLIAEQAVEKKLTRAQVAEMVDGAKAKKPPKQAAPKPQPVVHDLGGGVVVTVRWKRATKGTIVTAAQALQQALKREREQGRGAAPNPSPASAA
jgi:ParB family chromosome partitioning protein